MIVMTNKCVVASEAIHKAASLPTALRGNLTTSSSRLCVVGMPIVVCWL